MSFAIQNSFSFMRYHLLIFYCACTLKWHVQKGFSCANGYKTICQFIYYQIQYIWPYIEVLHPFRNEFCTNWWICICNHLHNAIQFNQHRLLKRLSSLPVFISLFLIKKSCVYRCVDLCLGILLKSTNQPDSHANVMLFF